MTTNEMKRILTQKLNDEGCYCKYSDISIRKHGDRFRVVVRDYEHFPFEIYTEDDDYFGFCVWVTAPAGPDYGEESIITFTDSKRDYDFRSALLRLGYYIGTRF